MDPELLKLNFPTFLNLSLPFAGFRIFLLYSRTCACVFELNLTSHRPALPEVVSEIVHGVGDVKAAMALVTFIIVRVGIPIDVIAVKVAAQRHFTVTADRQTAYILLSA